MSIHPDHNLLNFNQEAFEFICTNCSASTEGLPIGETVWRNYQCISESHRFAGNGQFRGQAFEIIVTDAIAKALGANEKIRGHVSYASQNAEIDIVIDHGSHVHGIFLKTSFRERWKQEDRDALLFQGHGDCLKLESALGHPVQRFTPWALVFKEHADYSPEKAVQHIRRMAQVFAGIPAENVMSVYDAERMTTFQTSIFS